MPYKLMLFTPGNEGCVVRSDISQDDYTKMVEAREKLRSTMTVVDYYNMCMVNIDDFIVATKRIWPSQIERWAEINRKFLNFVSSFYAYVEFLENTQKDVFSRIKGQYYNTHFEYRLIYNLRKYATHRGLVITRITYDVLKEKCSVQISPFELIEKGKEFFQPIVRSELMSKAEADEEIDVLYLAEVFRCIFQNMCDDIMRDLCKSALQFVQLLYSYYTSINTLSDYVIYDESDKYLWSISEALVNYREKMETYTIII